MIATLLGGTVVLLAVGIALIINQKTVIKGGRASSNAASEKDTHLG